MLSRLMTTTFSLLAAQYPLAYLGLHAGFTWINISQAIVLLPLFLFAYHMYRWENSDLVPIRCVTTGCLPQGPPYCSPHLHSQYYLCKSLVLQTNGGRGAGGAVLLMMSNVSTN